MIVCSSLFTTKVKIVMIIVHDEGRLLRTQGLFSTSHHNFSVCLSSEVPISYPDLHEQDKSHESLLFLCQSFALW